jgi:uncharacterized protein YqeY
MPKRQDLEADLKNAMRAGDDTRKRTLRMLLSAIKLAEVDKRGELDDSEMTTVIQREVKSRHETIHDAKQANRPDLVTAAEQEMEVLQAYLPEPLSDGELEGLVQRAIEECGQSDEDSHAAGPGAGRWQDRQRTRAAVPERLLIFPWIPHRR